VNWFIKAWFGRARLVSFTRCRALTDTHDTAGQQRDAFHVVCPSMQGALASLGSRRPPGGARSHSVKLGGC